SVRIWSAREAQVYDFEFPTQRSDSAQVDGGVTPRYQFYLEVECVAFPEEGDRPDDPKLVWGRETFAVATSTRSGKAEDIRGYYREGREAAAILEWLTRTLLVDLEHAKVLPVPEYDPLTVGKRISVHPLHEAFFGEVSTEAREASYRRAEPG